MGVVDMAQDYVDRWKRLGSLVGLNIDTVLSASLGLPNELGEVAVLRGYGAKNGMVLLPEGTSVLRYAEEIGRLGYGFSVVAAPAEATLVALASLNEMLEDWGAVED